MELCYNEVIVQIFHVMLKEYVFSSPRGRKAILGSGIKFFLDN